MDSDAVRKAARKTADELVSEMADDIMRGAVAGGAPTSVLDTRPALLKKIDTTGLVEALVRVASDPALAEAADATVDATARALDVLSYILDVFKPLIAVAVKVLGEAIGRAVVAAVRTAIAAGGTGGVGAGTVVAEVGKGTIGLLIDAGPDAARAATAVARRVATDVANRAGPWLTQKLESGAARLESATAA